MSVAVDLPELTADESAHGHLLTERIRDEVARSGGWMSFALARTSCRSCRHMYR